MNWKFWKSTDDKAHSYELDKKNSDEPWVQVVGEHVDPRKGLQIELDWNDAFVEYLRRNGYSGSSDEAIVQKWVAHLYKHLMTELNPTSGSTFE